MGDSERANRAAESDASERSNCADESSIERELGYPRPVSPYLSVSPYVARFRTFLRFYPDGTRDLIEEVFDEILTLPEERKFTESAVFLDDRFEAELDRPLLDFLPISRDEDEILADLADGFERGQQKTVDRLRQLEDPRAHLVVVVYTELLLGAIDALRTATGDRQRILSAVLPLIIRLDRAHGNAPMTTDFLLDAALSEYYLARAVGDEVDDHPGAHDVELVEFDVLAHGVVLTYRESDLSRSNAAAVLGLSEAEFDRLLEFYGVDDV